VLIVSSNLWAKVSISSVVCQNRSLPTYTWFDKDHNLYYNVSRKGCVSFILYVDVDFLLIRSNVIIVARIKQQIEKH
jgi:hypothetical protein